MFWKFRNGFSVAQQQMAALVSNGDGPRRLVAYPGGGKEGSYVIVQNGTYVLDYWTTTIRPELRYTMKAFLLEVSGLQP